MKKAIAKIFLTIYLTGISLLLSSINTLAQGSELRQAEFNLDSDHIAIEGYDVVSYFMGEPHKGEKTISYAYQGVIYWFSNSDNLDLFKKQPSKFEPVYGGWCAYAMGDSGEKVKIDPKTFKIIEGKLYLFYNFYFNNTLIDWNKNEQSLKSKADANWREIFDIL